MDKGRAFLIFCVLSLCDFQLRTRAKVVCLGVQCSAFSETSLLALNAVDPLLQQYYFRDFLFSMSKSAVLNNINASIRPAQNPEGPELGLAYSMARTRSRESPLLDYVGLSELPKKGIAISPAFEFTTPVSYFLGDGSLDGWSIGVHFFPYRFNETQVPFANIKKVNVNGRVFNSGIHVRYFPALPRRRLFGLDVYADGISFGAGYYHTNQNVRLDSYDRKSLALRFSDQSRRWLGINELKYRSDIDTGLLETSAGLDFGPVFLYAGLGCAINQNQSSLNLARNAAISNSVSSDDFVSQPTGAFAQIPGRLRKQYWLGFGSLGLEVRVWDASLVAELLKNERSESASIGVKYRF